MRTETQLKRYIRYQKYIKKPKIFNIYAFLLNSLFYLYFHIWGWFTFYFVSNLALSMIAYFTTRNFWAALASLLLLRLINGFSADYVCFKYIKSYVERNQSVNYSQPIIFFPIMARRFFIYNIISGGLYQFYWMFQNWKAVKRDTQDGQIHPFLQSWILGIFFIYSLLDIIIVNLKRSKIIGKKFFKIIYAYLSCLFGMTALFWIIGLSNLSVIPFYICSGLYFLLNIISTIFLTMIQKRINFHNRKKNPQLIMDSGYQNGGSAILAIGFLILNILLSYYFIPRQENPRLIEAVTSVYKMTKGYSHVCQKQGYKMKSFPLIYQEYFNEEINIIRRYLDMDNQPLDKIFRIIPQEKLTHIDEEILSEMDKLKPQIIEIIIKRKYYSLPTEGFDVNIARNFLQKEITLPVICSEMDLNAYSIINKNQNYKDNFRALVQSIR